MNIFLGILAIIGIIIVIIGILVFYTMKKMIDIASQCEQCKN